MPLSSSRPCIAPSSPSLPCRTGRTRSSGIVSCCPCSTMSNPWTLRSGDSAAGRQPPFSQPGSGPSQSFQAPLFVMPIQNGSYFSLSRFFAISCADLTDTGCSSEQPPNMIPSFSLSMMLPAFEVQAVDETVFDHVVQGVVCVIGGVRADKYIRQLLQPQKRFAFNWLVSAVGIKYSFLSFEDVQRRTAQPGAFQRRNKGLGIKK